jgi:hypothetical protein
MIERITAQGHENVTARHESTLEITTDEYLTPTGDCILGICADRAPDSFDPDFIDACQDRTASITLTLGVDNVETTVSGHGHPDLSFQSDRSLVCRTSDYVDKRTVMCRADAAAADLDREIVEKLTSGPALTATLEVH